MPVRFRRVRKNTTGTDFKHTLALLNVGGINSVPSEYGLGLTPAMMQLNSDIKTELEKKDGGKTLQTLLDEAVRPPTGWQEGEGEGEWIEKFTICGSPAKDVIEGNPEKGIEGIKTVIPQGILDTKITKLKTKLFSGSTKDVWENTTGEETSVEQIVMTVGNKNSDYSYKLDEKYFKGGKDGSGKTDDLDVIKKVLPEDYKTEMIDLEEFKSYLKNNEDTKLLIDKYFNVGLFAYTVFIAKLIYKIISKSKDKWWMTGSIHKDEAIGNIKKNKKKQIEELIKKYDIVCLNEVHDDLIDKKDINIIESNRSKDDTYSCIITKNTFLFPIYKPTDKDKDLDAISSALSSECVIAKFEDIYIICHHAPSFKPGHREKFKTVLKEISKQLSNEKVIYCVDSNSPFTTNGDIQTFDGPFTLSAPVNINENINENKNGRTEKTYPAAGQDPTSNEYYTTYKERTYLQTQLDKAGLKDKSSKDFIITKGFTKVGFPLVSRTFGGLKGMIADKADYTENKIPDENYPFDHHVVSIETADQIQVPPNHFEKGPSLVPSEYSDKKVGGARKNKKGSKKARKQKKSKTKNRRNGSSSRSVKRKKTRRN